MCLLKTFSETVGELFPAASAELREILRVPSASALRSTAVVVKFPPVHEELTTTEPIVPVTGPSSEQVPEAL